MFHVVLATFGGPGFEHERVKAVGGGERGELVPAHVDGVPVVEVGAVADVVAAAQMDSEDSGKVWCAMRWIDHA